MFALSLTSIGFFDREIQDAYCSTGLLEMYLSKPSLYKWRTRLPPSLLSRYLFNRTVTDRTNSNNFPAIIHHVVEYISSHDQTETKEQLEDIKRALMFSLCEVAANDAQWHGTDSWELLRCLTPNGNARVFKRYVDLVRFLELNSNTEVQEYYVCLLHHRLAAAAYFGKESLVQALLEDDTTCDATPIGETYFGTPIECAAKGGNPKVMRLLLQRTNIKAYMRFFSWNALSYAALAGHTHVVHVLLKPQYGFIEDKDACESAILQAARGGHPHLIKIIRRSSKVSLLRSIDNQILRQGALYGHMDVIRMALYSGADINSWWCCDRASRYFYPNCCCYDSAPRNSVPISDCYDRELSGASPLSLAAIRGHKQAVQLLLTHGAQNLSHQSAAPAALRHAVRKGFKSVAYILLDHWISGYPDKAISRWCTLHPVIVLRFNLNNDMVVENKDFAVSAIRRAAETGNDTVLRALLDAGVDINGGDDTESPMLGALCHGQDHIVKTLLARGAREVDPAKSIYADGFKKGEYPKLNWINWIKRWLIRILKDILAI